MISISLLIFGSLLYIFQAFVAHSKGSNYNWYNYYLHVFEFFQLSGKI